MAGMSLHGVKMGLMSCPKLKHLSDIHVNIMQYTFEGAVKPLATAGGYSLGSSLGSTTATVKPTLTLGATSSSASSTGEYIPVATTVMQ